MLTNAREIVRGAASLLEEVPVAGDVCVTFLAFEELVGTAKGNKEEFSVIRLLLCDVAIKSVLWEPSSE